MATPSASDVSQSQTQSQSQSQTQSQATLTQSRGEAVVQLRNSQHHQGYGHHGHGHHRHGHEPGHAYHTTATPSHSQHPPEPENPLTRSQEHGFTNIWSITHHHHIHHHHYHRDEDDLTQSHAHDLRSQLTTEGFADDTETEATTSEEDSIIIELADVAFEQVDPDEFDIIELDLDQLGIVEETGTEEGQQDEGPRIRITEEIHPKPPTKDPKKRRLSNALVGLPRKIRVLKPKVVHNILSMMEANTLRPVPKMVSAIAIAVAINGVLEFLAEVIIEILAATGIAYHHPGFFRMSFLFLEILSALAGLFTLAGIRARELDVTRESLILGFVIEAGLIASDIFFIAKEEEHPFPAGKYRIPFILLSSANVVGIAYIFLRLHLLDGLKRVISRFWNRNVQKITASFSTTAVPPSGSVGDMAAKQTTSKARIPRSASKGSHHDLTSQMQKVTTV